MRADVLLKLSCLLADHHGGRTDRRGLQLVCVYTDDSHGTRKDGDGDVIVCVLDRHAHGQKEAC